MSDTIAWVKEMDDIIRDHEARRVFLKITAAKLCVCDRALRRRRAALGIPARAMGRKSADNLGQVMPGCSLIVTVSREDLGVASRTCYFRRTTGRPVFATRVSATDDTATYRIEWREPAVKAPPTRTAIEWLGQRVSRQSSNTIGAP